MSIYVDGIKVAGFAGRRGPAGPQGEPGVDGPPGVQGPPGADGLTPHIGANGNWWLGETDTGVSAAGGGGTGGVTSFNGRSGEVVPQAGDYTAEMVGALPASTELPVVPEWAMQSEPPRYTAADVGAATMEEVNAAIQEAMSGLHTIALAASPPEGGSVTGGGVAAEGMTVTVSAEPADQYHQFAQWQEGGEVVGMEAAYSFPVSGDRALTAVFTDKRGSRLPEGYTEVEYIESFGSQAIDSGQRLVSNLKIVMDIWPEIDATLRSLFRSSKKIYVSPSDYYNVCAVSAYNNAGYNVARMEFERYKVNAATHTVVFQRFASGRMTVVVDGLNKTVSLNEESAALTGATNFDSALDPIALLGSTPTSKTNGTIGKLYSCQMYVGGEAVRDFVPCVRQEDSAVGLYDLVGGQFYPNSTNTGEFTAGPAV